MAVKHCAYCGVANGDCESTCQNCGGRFKGAAAPVDPPASYRSSAALDPTNRLLRNAIRQQHAVAACRALSGAALLSGVRAILMPALVDYPPPQFNDHASPLEIRITSLCLAAMFACMALWARREPLLASIAATLIYLAFVVPDVIAHPVLLGAGHVGKIVMLLVLARALATGLMHRHVGPTTIG